MLKPQEEKEKGKQQEEEEPAFSATASQNLARLLDLSSSSRRLTEPREAVPAGTLLAEPGTYSSIILPGLL